MDTRSSAVFVDEFDTRGFKSSADYVQRRSPRCVNACLKLPDRDDADTCMLSQIRLTPVN
jgi:hypothetical protein